MTIGLAEGNVCTCWYSGETMIGGQTSFSTLESQFLIVKGMVDQEKRLRDIDGTF